ncbi:MAG: hypothetical protein LBJ97_04265 [Mycoplasmataceae bacterium]|nr:hypothetical protein [Mycoplasmataceae bacterium]
MNKEELNGEQIFDFDWAMKYLGINNRKIIDQYKEWNHEQLAENHKDIKNVDERFPFKIYANKQFRGSHAGHYVPSSNIIEIKEEIDESNPTYWQKTLIAHEFTHALIGSEKIIGKRRGHGVLYYQCLVRDVIWYANNLSLSEKFNAVMHEFSYSCSLGQYRGTNRIFRSQSTRISLDLNYFTINSLFQDTRSDINNLGQWMWEKISEYMDAPQSKQELLDLPISDLISVVQKNLDGTEIVMNNDQQLKMFRR